MKFKIGDKVRRINYANGGLKVGDISTVIGFSPTGVGINVVLSDNPVGEQTHQQCNLELAEEYMNLVGDELLKELEL